MKINKLTFLLATILFSSLTIAQNATSWEEIRDAKKGTLTVYFYENSPFASLKTGETEPKGLEVDILKYFTKWVEDKKGVKINLEYHPYQNFESMFQAVSGRPANTIGLGTISITHKRKKMVKFSAPYLKNVSVLITDGSVNTSRSLAEIKENLSGLVPIVIKGTVHEDHIRALNEKIENTREPVYVNNPIDVPLKIAESSKYFGYTDIITFWSYVKSNNHYIKMQKMANINEERFGFIFPKNSDWDIIVNEFFESGFGFTSTKDYRQILKRYLGDEIIEKVELD